MFVQAKKQRVELCISIPPYRYRVKAELRTEANSGGFVREAVMRRYGAKDQFLRKADLF